MSQVLKPQEDILIGSWVPFPDASFLPYYNLLQDEDDETGIEAPTTSLSGGTESGYLARLEFTDDPIIFDSLYEAKFRVSKDGPAKGNLITAIYQGDAVVQWNEIEFPEGEVEIREEKITFGIPQSASLIDFDNLYFSAQVKTVLTEEKKEVIFPEQDIELSDWNGIDVQSLGPVDELEAFLKGENNVPSDIATIDSILWDKLASLERIDSLISKRHNFGNGYFEVKFKPLNLDDEFIPFTSSANLLVHTGISLFSWFRILVTVFSIKDENGQRTETEHFRKEGFLTTNTETGSNPYFFKTRIRSNITEGNIFFIGGGQFGGLFFFDKDEINWNDLHARVEVLDRPWPNRGYGVAHASIGIEFEPIEWDSENPCVQPIKFPDFGDDPRQLQLQVSPGDNSRPIFTGLSRVVENAGSIVTVGASNARMSVFIKGFLTSVSVPPTVPCGFNPPAIVTSVPHFILCTIRNSDDGTKLHDFGGDYFATHDGEFVIWSSFNFPFQGFPPNRFPIPVNLDIEIAVRYAGFRWTAGGLMARCGLRVDDITITMPPAELAIANIAVRVVGRPSSTIRLHSLDFTMPRRIWTGELALERQEEE